MFHVAMRSVPGARAANARCAGSALFVGWPFAATPSGGGDALDTLAFFAGWDPDASESGALRLDDEDEDACLGGISEATGTGLQEMAVRNRWVRDAPRLSCAALDGQLGRLVGCNLLRTGTAVESRCMRILTPHTRLKLDNQLPVTPRTYQVLFCAQTQG